MPLKKPYLSLESLGPGTFPKARAKPATAPLISGRAEETGYTKSPSKSGQRHTVNSELEAAWDGLMSHLAPDRAPAQELCGGGQRLGDTALFPAGSPHGSAPLALPVHPYYSQPCWRPAWLHSSPEHQGWPLTAMPGEPGPPWAIARLSWAPDVQGRDTGSPAPSCAGPEGSQNELSASPTPAAPGCVPPPRGQSLWPITEPHESQGAGSVRRAGPQFPAWHYLRRVAPVSIPR